MQAALDDVKSAPQPEAAPAPMGAAESGGSSFHRQMFRSRELTRGYCQDRRQNIYTLIQNKLHIIDANPNKPEIVGVIEPIIRAAVSMRYMLNQTSSLF